MYFIMWVFWFIVLFGLNAVWFRVLQSTFEERLLLPLVVAANAIPLTLLSGWLAAWWDGNRCGAGHHNWMEDEPIAAEWRHDDLKWDHEYVQYECHDCEATKWSGARGERRHIEGQSMCGDLDAVKRRIDWHRSINCAISYYDNVM